MFTKIYQLLIGLGLITLGIINFWDLSINRHNWDNKQQFIIILLSLGEIVIGDFFLYSTFCF